MKIDGLSNAYLITDEIDYYDRQVKAFQTLFKITRVYDIPIDVVYYNPRNDPDALTVDSFTNVPRFNYYLEYTDITFDEIDEQILSIYRNYKQESTETPMVDVLLRPFVMIIDGVGKIKQPDDFVVYLEEELTLMEFLNVYVIAIV